ncbi:MAG: hypothetical protein R3F61_24920 [Myxococcota bacterium]
MLVSLLMSGVALADEPIGTWVYSNPMWGETITLELRADGTGALDGDPFRYTWTPGRLEIDQYGERLVYTVQIAGNQLTATGGDLEGTLLFTRTGGTAAPAPAPAPAPVSVPAPASAPSTPTGPSNTGIVGTWTDGNGSLTFNADGTCDYVGQRLTWTYDGTTAVLTGPAGTVSIPLRIEGDRMTLTQGAETQTLTRGKPTAPAADASGLAGVYVASEVSMNASYAMSTTQYLTLWPDGTVGWTKSELGASRTQVTENLERFSSFRTNPSARGQTYGTWQATGGGVIVQWQIWNGLRCEGRVDPSTGAIHLTGMGILNEGATLVYERQR